MSVLFIIYVKESIINQISRQETFFTVSELTVFKFCKSGPSWQSNYDSNYHHLQKVL